MLTISWVTGRRVGTAGPGWAWPEGRRRARLRPALRASPKESARDGPLSAGYKTARSGRFVVAVLRLWCLDSGRNLGGRGIGHVLGFERHVGHVQQRVLILRGNQFLGLCLGVHAGHGAGQRTLG